MKRTKKRQDEPVLKGTIIERLRRRTVWIGAAEARELVGKEKATLCRMVKQGKFGAKGVIRSGNQNLYDPAMLADWLEQRQI